MRPSVKVIPRMYLINFVTNNVMAVLFLCHYSDSPCIGTDLNRNYDSNWGGQGASPVPCSETFRGDFAFSAEESAAQRDYLASHTSALELFLTFHSYSQVIYDNILI